MLIVFEKIETESGYDFVSVESGRGESVDSVSGVKMNYVSEYVSGDTAVVRLKSDSSEARFGFSIKEIQIVE